MGRLARSLAALALASAALASSGAWAHTGGSALGGFACGFLHPLGGADHVLATGTIHLTGIALGLVTRLPNGVQVLRAGGSAIAAAGVYLAWRPLRA